jgi:pimeloyl-ACP methyl ester carboxylesterase
MHVVQRQYTTRRGFVRSTLIGAASLFLGSCLRHRGGGRWSMLQMRGSDMYTVASRDGTPIAIWRSGQGPALLLIHGMVADHTTTWRLVLPELERRFTVYAMDRRGRGGSGDSARYELRLEAEDVAAVIDSVAGPVDVLAHSYGGLCALEGALLATNLERLIIYEGVPPDAAGVAQPGVIDELEALLATGQVEEMLRTFLRDVAGASPAEIELIYSDREAWARRLSNAPTIPRELKAWQSYDFVPERFRDMRTPTLLLVGGESPRQELESASAVAQALPDARVVLLPGQQHLAMYTAPEVLVSEVVRFLEP